MNNITTYNDLLLEKQRLKLLLEDRKILVQAEFEEIKVKLKPFTHLVEVVEKFISRDKSNPLFNLGVDLGVNLVLKKLIFRNAGFLVKLLVPLLTQNYLSHEIEEGKHIFSKITGFLKKQFKRHQPA